MEMEEVMPGVVDDCSNAFTMGEEDEDEVEEEEEETNEAEDDNAVNDIALPLPVAAVEPVGEVMVEAEGGTMPASIIPEGSCAMLRKPIGISSISFRMQSDSPMTTAIIKEKTCTIQKDQAPGMPPW